MSITYETDEWLPPSKIEARHDEPRWRYLFRDHPDSVVLFVSALRAALVDAKTLTVTRSHLRSAELERALADEFRLWKTVSEDAHVSAHLLAGIAMVLEGDVKKAVADDPVEWDEPFTESVSNKEQLLRYMRNRSRQLPASDLDSDAAVHRSITLMRQIAPNLSIYPYMSLDDGEVTLFWVANKFSLELGIPTEGNVYLSIRDPDGRIVRQGAPDALPLVEIQRALSRIYSETERSNPTWRDLFEEWA